MSIQPGTSPPWLNPKMRSPTLRGLLEEALAAADAVKAAYDNGASEWVIDIRENRAFDTRRALQDYLLFEHGIGTALAGRMGEVL